MTLEEAKRLAEQGDTNAMCNLGDYFADRNTGNDMEEAAKWYEMAAERNVVYAAQQVVLIKKLLAYGGMEALSALGGGEMEWIFLKEEWEDAYSAVLRKIKMIQDQIPGAEGIDRDETIEQYNDATYHLALCYYRLDDYQKVISLTEDRDEPRAKILYGSALVSIANGDENVIETAIRQYQIIEENTEYALSEKSYWEEVEYCVSARVLSEYYRLGYRAGLRGTVPNLERAYNLLNFVKPYLKNNGLKNRIEEELSHYHKKIFGGYKYV